MALGWIFERLDGGTGQCGESIRRIPYGTTEAHAWAGGFGLVWRAAAMRVCLDSAGWWWVRCSGGNEWPLGAIGVEAVVAWQRP